MPIKTAAIQMCSSHIVDDNLETARKLITEAAHHGAKFIALPEMFAIMGMDTKDRNQVKESAGTGKIQQFLADMAREHQCWLVGGTIPIASDAPDKVYAASFLFNDQGQAVARYNKIHLFDVALSATEQYTESATIVAGNEIVVAQTPFGNVGMAVCYDVRFPELFRCQFNSGADMFVLPSAFTVKTGAAHWDVLVRSRAIENFCYMIAPAQGGTHSRGRKTYGHSMIVSPWGDILAKIAGDEPGVIYAEIDLAQIKQCREAIPVALHQRICFDLGKLR